MSPTQASSSPYDPHILAAELGKLFDLPLTANMISLDGVHFRTWSGDTGVLRVELVKSVSTSQARQIFKAARIPSEEEVRRTAVGSTTNSNSSPKALGMTVDQLVSDENGAA